MKTKFICLTPRDYYRNDLKKLYKKLIPRNKNVLVIKDLHTSKRKSKFDYLILDNIIGNVADIQDLLTKLKNNMHQRSRVIITYYNHLWEPVLKIASYFGLREKTPSQNWLDSEDIKNLLELSDYDVITTQKRLLFPIYIPFLSDLVNKWLSPLPIINAFCLTSIVIARPKPKRGKEYTVSIIIPARNEEENIPKIVKSIPKFGRSMEIVFVEGHSEDNTWDEINKELKKRHPSNISVKAYKQHGMGKANAVKLGFQKASGEILMIYDADRTVSAKDLKKFYNALASGIGEFANGSRLVYPIEKEAMQTLNKFANKAFSSIFSWILNQHFKDTLCGTKAIFKEHYEDIKKLNKFSFQQDPFGDFYLIFGSVMLNLKVVEIPVPYKQRQYGSTNINRFLHGFLLLKMTLLAFTKIKAF